MNSQAETSASPNTRNVQECQRGSDPVSQLSRRLNHVVTTAVDPLQIATALEVDGLSDDTAVKRYGRQDVFDLANELYRRVPLRVARPERPAHKKVSAWRFVAHGALFAAPGLFALACLRDQKPRLAGVAFLAAVFVGWAAGQGISVLGYTVAGRVGHGAAARFLLAALLMTVLLVAGAMTIGVLMGAPVPIVGTAAGQVAYVLAVTVLLVLDREPIVYVILVPGVIAAGAALYGVVPHAVGMAAAAITVGALVGTAGVVAWRTWSASVPRARLTVRDVGQALTVRDVGRALLYGMFALTSATLVSFDTVVELASGSSLGLVGLDYSLIALVLSMGVLEWQVLSTRSKLRSLLHYEEDLARFRQKAMRIACRALCVYLLVLIMMIVVGATIAKVADPGLSSWISASTVSRYLLGGIFFVSLELGLVGYVKASVIPIAIAAFAGIAVLLAQLFAHLSIDAHVLFAFVCVLALLGLLFVWRQAIRSVVALS